MKFKQNGIKTAILILLAVLFVVGVYYFLPTLLSGIGFLIRIFLPFILGYFVSLLINPLADRLQKKWKLPRRVSAILVIVLTVGILGGILTAIIWKLVEEIKSLYQQFPYLYESAKLSWEQTAEKLSNLYIAMPQGVQEFFDNLGTQISAGLTKFFDNLYVVERAGNFAKSLPSVFIALIVFILSLYFMVADAKDVQNAMHRLLSDRVMEKFERIKHEIKRYMGGYVKAQLIIMCVASVILLIGLTILGVDYALLIAVGIAVLDALPFFGSGAVLWPWAAVSFLNGVPRLGVGLLIIYLILVLCRQTIEPKIVSSNIGMHPILTLMAMYVGYKTLSIGGMIFGPLILMLFFSLYKVGVFDPVTRFFHQLVRLAKREWQLVKNIFQE